MKVKYLKTTFESESILTNITSGFVKNPDEANFLPRTLSKNI